MITEPFHTTFNYHLLPASNAPWLNSRTRKRVRDNRPDETQIQFDTVRRLFQAQRPQQHQAEDSTMDGLDYYNSPTAASPPIGEHMHERETFPMATPDLDVPEANQRSLHDFFGSRVPRKQQFSHSHSNSITFELEHHRQQQGSTARPPTPQEISAGAPAPVFLRERSSMGFLSSINTSPAPSHDEREIYEDIPATLGGIVGGMATGGGFLPCDFRSRADVEAMMGACRGDAMVMG